MSSYRVGMVSLGCLKNQMDAELMLARLRDAGMEITAGGRLGRCGDRQHLRIYRRGEKKEAIDNILEFAQLKKEGQIQKIIVTGCLAQRYQQELVSELPECDGVLGLAPTAILWRLCVPSWTGRSRCAFPRGNAGPGRSADADHSRLFFAYLRIGDGCSNRRAYCAIPLIRGPLAQPEYAGDSGGGPGLADGGVKELILVAQDTTLYGVDQGGCRVGSPRLPRNY